MRKLLLVIAAFLFVGFLPACKKAPSVQKKVVPVKVEKVKQVKYTITRPVIGYLKSDEVVLRSISGGKIEKIYKKEGDFVKKGEVIAEIGSSIFKRRLEMAKAQLKNASDEFNRVDKLFKKGLLSKSQWEKAKLALTLAEKQSEIAERNYKLSLLTAPFSGYLDFFDYKVGDMVSPGMAVGKIVKLANFRIEAYLPAGNFPVKYGDYISVSVADKMIKGRIIYISKSYLPTANFRKLVIRVPYLKDLLPGAAATVFVPVVKEKEGILAPLDAVKFMKEGKSVFIIENNIAREIPVKTGDIVDEKIEILSGLKEGDLLVVEGQHYLKTGTEVAVK